MKRAERHHLKQDEFVQGIERTTDWVAENQRRIVNAVLVVLGVTLLLGGLYIYRSRRSAQAQARLTEALEIYHRDVRSSDGAAPSGEAPTFANAEEKYRAALEAFEGVADEFSGYEAGRQARYYVGVCHAGLKDYERAEGALAGLGSGSRDLLYYLGTQALAAVKAEREDYAGAADILRSLLEDDASPLPKDYVLFELAKTEEKAGNLDQARLYYERMVSEHPDSQLRGDAMNRRDALEFVAS
ncbi:MAG TPA: tetratricopeptide repeat protein [Vicinamibacteria bacterium]|nr:tetratricopeptide repeat protein [Vicinamibacteria bacterium]